MRRRRGVPGTVPAALAFRGARHLWRVAASNLLAGWDGDGAGRRGLRSTLPATAVGAAISRSDCARVNLLPVGRSVITFLQRRRHDCQFVAPADVREPAHPGFRAHSALAAVLQSRTAD